MSKRTSFFILLFLSSLILISFFPGCLPVTPVTVTGTISGYVAIPDETSKDLTGYSPIPGATVTIVDADGVTHTVLTDENGYYYFNNISIKTNTIINITKDTEGGGKLIFKDIVPLVVSQEEDYDAGIADAESTAIALVVEGLVNLGQVQEEIDLDEITSSDGFDELKEDIQQAQEDNQDINTDLINTQAEEIADNIVNPPEPTPTPTPLSSAKAITAFSFQGLAPAVVGIVDENAKTIALTVPNGTVVTALVATFTNSAASVVTVGGTAQTSGTTANNFTSPVAYLVTAQDGTTATYTVTVTVEPSHVATVTSGTYTVSAGGTASETITNVSFGTAKATFLAALTKGQVNQTWVDTAIADPVVSTNTLVVTAQDGTTVVTYTVTVNAELLAIGDTGPAGGLIFYDKGSVLDGWRYLEAAPSDQNQSADVGIIWAIADYQSTAVTGTLETIGSGSANTGKIIAQNGVGITYAAGVCDALVYGGYSDWFLPSKDELNLMYTNLKVAGVGGFAGNFYWSSSEFGARDAWGQHFLYVTQGNSNKNGDERVRAVRAF